MPPTKVEQDFIDFVIHTWQREIKAQRLQGEDVDTLNCTYTVAGDRGDVWELHVSCKLNPSGTLIGPQGGAVFDHRPGTKKVGIDELNLTHMPLPAKSCLESFKEEEERSSLREEEEARVNQVLTEVGQNIFAKHPKEERWRIDFDET